MDCELVFRLLVLFGLLLNFVGTLLIAFSIVFSGKDIIGIVLARETGRGKGDEVVEKKSQIPKFKKRMFRWGVCVFAAGFVSQVIGVFLEIILVCQH